MIVQIKHLTISTCFVSIKLFKMFRCAWLRSRKASTSVRTFEKAAINISSTQFSRKLLGSYLFLLNRRHIPTWYIFRIPVNANSSASFLSTRREVYLWICVRCSRIPDRINNGGEGNDRRDACSAIWLHAERRTQLEKWYMYENVNRSGEKKKKKKKRNEKQAFDGNIGESTEITSSPEKKEKVSFRRWNLGNELQWNRIAKVFAFFFCADFKTRTPQFVTKRKKNIEINRNTWPNIQLLWKKTLKCATYNAFFV